MLRTRLLALFAAGFAAGSACAQTAVPIAWLRQEMPPPRTLSELDPPPADLGIAGATLAIADTNTTGRFLGHGYTLEQVSVPEGGDMLAAAREVLARTGLVLLDAPAETLLMIADLPEAEDALILDTASGAANLRSQDCRANVLHTALEQAALSDALMQVLKAKRWSGMAMVTGPTEADRAMAGSLRASALKYGMEIAAEKAWTFDSDLRRSASNEVPLFTQGFPDHDVLLVADAADDFARYIPDNTWLPRPVAGATGLTARAWAPVLEQWGASQLQDRFDKVAHRPMQDRDYAAWIAIRALGEAVTRTSSADPATLRGYMLSPDFELDGFKGRPLSFRPWNGQLRQPIPVVNDRALVDMAPLEPFLHQVNELDTLGLDRPESACTAFGD